MSYTFMDLDPTGNVEKSIRDWKVDDGSIIETSVVSSLDDKHFAVVFAAVRSRHFNDRIGAITFLLKLPPDDDGTDCLIREVLETEGPAACFCPDSILDRLEPTRDVVALSWRKRCRFVKGWEDERWAKRFLANLPRLN